MAKLSLEQQVEVSKLEQWYASRIAELKEREIKIIKEYDAKKMKMLKQQMNERP